MNVTHASTAMPPSANLLSAKAALKNAKAARDFEAMLLTPLLDSLQKTVKAKDSPAKRLEIGEGASIDQLVSGLQNMGATARDVISILQAIKAAGALDADLEVI